MALREANFFQILWTVQWTSETFWSAAAPRVSFVFSFLSLWSARLARSQSTSSTHFARHKTKRCPDGPVSNILRLADWCLHCPLPCEKITSPRFLLSVRFSILSAATAWLSDMYFVKPLVENPCAIWVCQLYLRQMSAGLVDSQGLKHRSNDPSKQCTGWGLLDMTWQWLFGATAQEEGNQESIEETPQFSLEFTFSHPTRRIFHDWGQFSTFKQTLSVHFAVERHENRLRTWDSSFASRCAGSSSGEGVADREVGKWWNSLSSCCLEGIGVPLQLLELSPLFMQVGKWPHVSGNDRFRGMQFPFQWVLHFYYQLHVWRS